MNYDEMFKTKQITGMKIFNLLTAFLLVISTVLKAQSREFNFSNSAQKEGINIIQSNSSCIQIQYSIKHMEINHKNINNYSGDQIVFNNISIPFETGNPNLPSENHMIAIPNGSNVSLEINSSQIETINNVDLLPVALIDNGLPSYEKNMTIYSNDSFYPQNIVTITDITTLRGVRVACFSIVPFQYNPVTKILRVYHDLDISISYVGGNGYFGEDRLRSPYFDPILQQNILNYNQLPSIDYGARILEWIANNEYGCEYLIVIPNCEAFRASAQQLANYRIKQGIKTEVKTLNEMGCDSYESLRNYFINAYNNWTIPPVAVCLLGDHNSDMSQGIPTYTHHNTSDEQPIKSDNYYADTNNDNLPDIVFSRLVASNAAEAHLLVKKQIDYEYDSPNTEIDFYKNPVASMGWHDGCWYQITSEALVGYWNKKGKTPLRVNNVASCTTNVPDSIWSTVNNTDLIIDLFGPNGRDYIPQYPFERGNWIGGTSSQIISAINSGAFFLQHGENDAKVEQWDYPTFTENNVSQLTNVGRLTFVVLNEPNTGQFVSNYSCLCEDLMRHSYNNQPAGAVGCLASCSASHPIVRDLYLWGLYDHFDQSFITDDATNTDYLNNWMPAFGNVAGKYYLMSNTNTYAPHYNEDKTDIYYSYTAHCDAFLRLYTEVPQQIIAEHPSKVSMAQGTVSIKAPQNSFIALTVGNNIIGFAQATGDYQTVHFQPQPTNVMIDIVITKQDCFRYEGHLTEMDASLIGPSTLDPFHCEDYEYIVNLPENESFSCQWFCSSNLIFTSSNNQRAHVKVIGTGSAYVYVNVYYNGISMNYLYINIDIDDSYQNIIQTELTSNTTWSANNLLLNHMVLVKPGTTLTINGTIYCTEEALIRVQAGAKLIIDGGLITSVCKDSQWCGIQVMGRYYHHQYDEGSGLWQGCVVMKNGATIENALVAIDIGSILDDQGHYFYTGGIIQATNACFINNTSAIKFYPFENEVFLHGKTYIRDNVSFFKNCEFRLDDNYQCSNVFQSHVFLYGVRGVKFYGCSFNLWHNGTNIDPHPIAINALDAGFNVFSHLVYGTPKKCSFNNFYKAIACVDGSSASKRLNINNAEFNGNDFGVYLSNTGFATVKNSHFGVGNSYSCSGTGIYALRASSFNFKYNFFEKENGAPDGYGIVVDNCQGINSIEDNEFSNLYCGNLAIGDNHDVINQQSGLEFRCNGNSSNTMDFYVKNIQQDPTYGIQWNQGGQDNASKNTFSTNAMFHFVNEGTYINYFYDQNEASQEMPIRYTEDKIALEPTGQGLSCSDGSGSGNDQFVLSEAERYQRELDFSYAKDSYNNLKTIFEHLVDGGNTQDVKAEIQNATPSKMWELRAMLLGASPYLSEDVLKEAADRDDVFTESVLFEILASNPDELKKESLLDYIRDKQHPLPDYMIEILQQMASGITCKTAMQGQMAKYSHDYTEAANDIVRSLLSDTIIDMNEVRSWLGSLNNLRADQEIIATFADQGDFGSAFALADLLPELYGLQGNDLDEHHDYIELLGLYRTLHQQQRNLFQLSQEEEDMVENFAIHSTGTPKAMATAILHGTLRYFVTDCPDAPIPTSGDRSISNSYSQEDLSHAVGMKVTTKPNPATTWVAIDYQLPKNATKATFTLTNGMGVKVIECGLAGHVGQKVIDLHDVASGVYVFSVLCGEYYQTGKLIVTH